MLQVGSSLASISYMRRFLQILAIVSFLELIMELVFGVTIVEFRAMIVDAVGQGGLGIVVIEGVVRVLILTGIIFWGMRWVEKKLEALRKQLKPPSPKKSRKVGTMLPFPVSGPVEAR